MARILKGKGFEDEVVHGVLREIEEKGLLDDAALSRDIVREGQRSGRGRSRVRAEMLRRGIPRELCEEAMREHFDPSLEEEAALRRLGTMLGEDLAGLEREAWDRAARKLAARGFSPSAVRAALACARSGSSGEDECFS